MNRTMTRTTAGWMWAVAALLAVPAAAVEARAQVDGYDHADHRHQNYNRVRRFGLHGHIEGPAFHVRAVTPGTAAERAGFQAGDRITRIDGDPITSIQQFCAEMIEAEEDDDEVLEFQIWRNGSYYRIVAPY